MEKPWGKSAKALQNSITARFKDELVLEYRLLCCTGLASCHDEHPHFDPRGDIFPSRVRTPTPNDSVVFSSKADK